MDITELVREIVLRLHTKSAGNGLSVQLSLPLNVSAFFWHDCSLETMIERFVRHAESINHPERPVRISVHQKAKMSDLENFFNIYPSRWIQLSIEGHGSSGFEGGARQILEESGYRCEEWAGVEDSGQQLAAYCFGTEQEPKLVVWSDNRKSSHKCDLLIPITKSISQADCDNSQ